MAVKHACMHACMCLPGCDLQCEACGLLCRAMKPSCASCSPPAGACWPAWWMRTGGGDLPPSFIVLQRGGLHLLHGVTDNQALSWWGWGGGLIALRLTAPRSGQWRGTCISTGGSDHGLAASAGPVVRHFRWAEGWCIPHTFTVVIVLAAGCTLWRQPATWRAPSSSVKRGPTSTSAIKRVRTCSTILWTHPTLRNTLLSIYQSVLDCLPKLGTLNSPCLAGWRPSAGLARSWQCKAAPFPW